MHAENVLLRFARQEQVVSFSGIFNVHVKLATATQKSDGDTADVHLDLARSARFPLFRRQNVTVLPWSTWGENFVDSSITHVIRIEMPENTLSVTSTGPHFGLAGPARAGSRLWGWAWGLQTAFREAFEIYWHWSQLRERFLRTLRVRLRLGLLACRGIARERLVQKIHGFGVEVLESHVVLLVVLWTNEEFEPYRRWERSTWNDKKKNSFTTYRQSLQMQSFVRDNVSARKFSCQRGLSTK